MRYRGSVNVEAYWKHWGRSLYIFSVGAFGSPVLSALGSIAA